MKIAFFDFDGTITKVDTLIDFIRYAKGDLRFSFGMFVLLPMLFLYKVKIIPNYKAKQLMISHFFKGMDEENFMKLTSTYSLNKIDAIVRKQAMEKIKWHQEQGDELVIVSASMECWLKPWCDKNKISLIATKLEMKNKKVSGKFLTKNCYGEEKVNRIKNKYNLQAYTYIYAYGDSRGDHAMLSIADSSNFKPFTT